MSEIKIINKLGAGYLGFEPKKIRKMIEQSQDDNNGSEVRLYKVYGLVLKTKTGTHKENGDWTGFLGQFEAVVIDSGKIVRSGQLFLPTMITPIMESQIASAKELYYKANIAMNKEDDDDEDDEIVPPTGENTNSFSGVRFAFEIGAKENDRKGGVGYEFVLKNLMPETKTDMLTGMREQFGTQKDTKVLEEA